MATITRQINVGTGLSPDELQVELGRHLDDLADGLVILPPDDDRATYCPDTLGITLLEKMSGKRGQYILHYTYEWGSYSGCPDICDADIEDRYIEFKYWGGIATFQWEQTEERDTRDEF